MNLIVKKRIKDLLLFYLKKLAVAKRENTEMEPSSFGNVKNSIKELESEHVTVGGSMDEINRLSNNYTTPEDACSSYRALYSKLDEFEQDLHQHIHLENNILFPKASKLENDFGINF